MRQKVPLIRIARLASIDSYDQLVKKYPNFSIDVSAIIPKEQGRLSDWEFYSLAAVGGLILGGKENYPGEHAETEHELSTEDSQLVQSTSDFIQFVNNGDSKEYNEIRAVVGMWFMWNVTGQQPSAEVIAGVGSVIGGMLLMHAGYSPPTE